MKQDEKLVGALKRIRAICRDGTLLTDVKIMEIYYEATAALDVQQTLLADMRTGRK